MYRRRLIASSIKEQKIKNRHSITINTRLARSLIFSFHFALRSAANSSGSTAGNKSRRTKPELRMNDLVVFGWRCSMIANDPYWVNIVIRLESIKGFVAEESARLKMKRKKEKEPLYVLFPMKFLGKIFYSAPYLFTGRHNDPTLAIFTISNIKKKRKKRNLAVGPAGETPSSSLLVSGGISGWRQSRAASNGWSPVSPAGFS